MEHKRQTQNRGKEVLVHIGNPLTKAVTPSGGSVHRSLDQARPKQVGSCMGTRCIIPAVWAPVGPTGQ